MHSSSREYSYLIIGGPSQISSRIAALDMRPLLEVPIEDISEYDDAFFKAMAIDESDIVIIDNLGRNLTPKELIFYLIAFLFDKPVIIFDLPTFDENGSIFLKNIIKKALSKTFLCNLYALDDKDLKQFMYGCVHARVNYQLTKQQRTLVRAEIRSFFRQLLPS